MKRVLSSLTLLIAACNIYAQEAVDLGLSVKWANMNIGASDIYDGGEYFAWGETETKGEYDFDWEHYFDADIDYMRRVKMKLFKTGSYSSIKGHRSYDVAAKRLGGNWRMPTPDECRELARNCKLQLIYDKSRRIYYWEFIGANGNSIIIPSRGYMCDNGKVGGLEFWTTKLDESNDSRAYSAQFSRGFAGSPWAVQPENRSFGLVVRPVFDGIEKTGDSTTDAIALKWNEAKKYINLYNQSSNPNDRYSYLNKAEAILKDLETNPNVEKIVEIQTIKKIRKSIKSALDEFEDM